MSQAISLFKVKAYFFFLSFVSLIPSNVIGQDQNTNDKCRISKSVNFYPSDGTKYTITFEVDNQSRLVKEASTFKHPDASQDFEKVIISTYDTKGFLTNRVTNTTVAKANEYIEKSIVEKFTYVDERLQETKVSWIYDDTSRNFVSNTENKYDETGNLSERIITTKDGVIRHKYTKGKVIGITDPKATYIVNSQGYVTKKTESTGAYTVYNYNAKNQPLNQISYNPKGEKTREDSFAYSSKLYKAPTNPVPYKGHPSIPGMYGDTRFLQTKYKVSYIKVPGTSPNNYETVYTYELDRNGNIKSRVSMTGTDTTSDKETVEYTYVGCK